MVSSWCNTVSHACLWYPTDIPGLILVSYCYNTVSQAWFCNPTNAAQNARPDPVILLVNNWCSTVSQAWYWISWFWLPSKVCVLGLILESHCCSSVSHVCSWYPTVQTWYPRPVSGILLTQHSIPGLSLVSFWCSMVSQAWSWYPFDAKWYIRPEPVILRM